MENSEVSPVAAHAKQVWDAVLGEIQIQVTRPCYETWFKNTEGVGRENGHLIVETPNTFVAEMLEQRMYSIICQAAERVAHEEIAVKFQVVGGSPDVPDDESSFISPVQPVPRAQNPRESLKESAPATPPGSNGNGAIHHAAQKGSANSLPSKQDPKTTAIRKKLNSTYTFESFIVGKSNELAHAAALAVVDNPGHIYNPLFLYADVGLGKTHLLHAVGHALSNKGLNSMYSTTEEFTNEYVQAIRDGRTEEFRARYRTADVLLLDDIQFLIGKEQTQEGFFHTFNALHMASRQIVITSDRPVSALTLLEDRVRSRLAGGLVADINAPDLETRVAILRAKADSTRRSFSPEVLEFLAERIHRNIRELEGSLNRLTAYADLVGVDVTIEVARRVVSDSLNGSRRPRPTDRAVITAVATYFQVDKDVLLGRRRDKHTALARQVAMYLLREESQLGLSQVGRAIGGKDHSTVLHACQKITQLAQVDPHLRQDLLNIRETLQASP